jgi:hypothetical protein
MMKINLGGNQCELKKDWNWKSLIKMNSNFLSNEKSHSCLEICVVTHFNDVFNHLDLKDQRSFM